MISTIVSGGQSGVDRAALDAAIASGLHHGGWCPLGRKAEDGRIPERYALVETPSAGYAERTAMNVRDSDATLVLLRGVLQGGTKLTLAWARRLGRPARTVFLDGSEDADAITDWLESTGVKVLNVAGPRESSRPGIYTDARRFVERVICCGRRSTPGGS